MKKILATLALSLVALISTSAVFAQDGAKISFSKTTHDYGDVKYDADGACTFEFKNTGNAPLIISHAQGSCGCTVPEWPKEPIAPGAKGVIRVKYDTKRPGEFQKTVTITSNAVDNPSSTLYIKGTVGAKPESGSPVNNAGAPSNH